MAEYGPVTVTVCAKNQTFRTASFLVACCREYSIVSVFIARPEYAPVKFMASTVRTGSIIFRLVKTVAVVGILA